jgi:hypothetical protein
MLTGEFEQGNCRAVLDKPKQALPYLCSYGIIEINLTDGSIPVLADAMPI